MTPIVMTPPNLGRLKFGTNDNVIIIVFYLHENTTYSKTNNHTLIPHWYPIQEK